MAKVGEMVDLVALYSWLLPCPRCGDVRPALSEDLVARELVVCCGLCLHEVRALSREGLISAWNGGLGTPPRPAPSDEAETPSEASLEARLASIEGKLDRILAKVRRCPKRSLT